MIGDSWQLRKYSLLGHWAVHCVESSQILAHMLNGKMKTGARKVGMDEREREQKTGGAG